jgi:hypothetical protein
MQVYGGGKIDWATVAADAFGNAIGNAIGERAAGALEEARVSRLTAKALARADLPLDLIDHRKTYEAAELLVREAIAQNIPLSEVVKELSKDAFRGMLGELDGTVSGGLTDAQANGRVLDAVATAQAARAAPAVPVVAVARVPGGPEIVELEEVVVTGYRRGKTGNDILQHAVVGGLYGLEALTQAAESNSVLASGVYRVTKTLTAGGPVGALAKKLTMHALDTATQALQAQLSNRAQVATADLVSSMAEQRGWSVSLALGPLDATLGANELGMAAGQLSAGVVEMFFDAGLKQIAGRGKNVRGIVEESKQPGQAREATGFLGRAGQELKNAPYQKVRNKAAQVNGRDFSGHALDQMQNRGVVPSVVENVLSTGSRFPTRAGTTGFYDAVNNVRVIVNSETGRVVTVIRGAP